MKNKTLKGISLVYIKYCLIRFEISKEDIYKYIDILHINKRQLKILIKISVGMSQWKLYLIWSKY